MSFSFASSSIQVYSLCCVLQILQDKFLKVGLRVWIYKAETLISMPRGSKTLVLLLQVPWRLTSWCQLPLNSFTSELEHWKELRIELVLDQLEPNAQRSNNMLTFMLVPFTWCNSNILLSWQLFTLLSCSVLECHCFSH